MLNKIEEFIERHWDECIKENRCDEDTLIGMPYPYTVPAVGHFNEMYYWDTFFTNEGLMCCGREAQAKNNTDNMLYLINKYGFMPNGNRTYYLYKSQPPFLSAMVRRIYEFYKDKAWLTGAYVCLKTEYSFWMTDRMTPVGLNAYGGTWQPGAEEALKKDFARRSGFMPEEDSFTVSKHYIISCESGWDCNPRWGMEGYNYAHVDLNALLYQMEKNMEYFANELGNGEEKLWEQRAVKRRELMFKYMDNGEGLLVDYNFKDNCPSKMLSAASFMPLFTKLATMEQAKALVNNIGRLEAEYGIYTCEENESPGIYQWDYPNGWACLQHIAFIGLDNYGFKEEAKRIAAKYVWLVEKVFDETGNLWEKYNVKDGSIAVKTENKMPPMMGWSAGIYLAAGNYLKNVC